MPQRSSLSRQLLLELLACAWDACPTRVSYLGCYRRFALINISHFVPLVRFPLLPIAGFVTKADCYGALSLRAQGQWLRALGALLRSKRKGDFSAGYLSEGRDGSS